MEEKDFDFRTNFDINMVSFQNVGSEFERKFRERYNSALNMMSVGKNTLANANGANALGVLEKMAQHMTEYGTASSFEESYDDIVSELGSFQN